ncbi:extracellular calcium-sensing receptor-like [Solea senegalensis]|uniref:Extracellular calcium-sensing receptor-like n=1 Tax=Solea senegalensis TaxID=28829 RepID=A0AAV6PUH8_SOLSE|nr:extracellular calcium-sensing receptor-like [Solea senegalensis]
MSSTERIPRNTILHFSQEFLMYPASNVPSGHRGFPEPKQAKLLSIVLRDQLTNSMIKVLEEHCGERLQKLRREKPAFVEEHREFGGNYFICTEKSFLVDCMAIKIWLSSWLVSNWVSILLVLDVCSSLKGQFHLNGMHKTGDVILGGLFTVNLISTDPDLSFTSEPQMSDCYGFDVIGFRQAQTMAFAIDEINRNSNLLPNVTLGYSMYDNCFQLGIGFCAALTLVSGQEEQVTLEENCVGNPPVLGIVGDSSSTNTIAISTVLGLYSVPLVSYFATCSCLSDRQKFPSFFRTIPSDAFQVNAMIQILKHFGWTWAGLLISDNDYGFHAARSFHSDLGPAGGGCLAYTEILPLGNDPAELRKIVDVMRKSTARVVIVFANNILMINLMKEVVRQNVTGLQWIASEAWTSAAVLQTPHLMPYLGGTLGIAIRRGEIPGFRDFLLQIHPDLHHNNTDGNSMVRVSL